MMKSFTDILNLKGVDCSEKLILIVIESEIGDSAGYVLNSYISEVTGLPVEITREKIKGLIRSGHLKIHDSIVNGNGQWSSKYEIFPVKEEISEEKKIEINTQRERNKKNLAELMDKINTGTKQHGLVPASALLGIKASG